MIFTQITGNVLLFTVRSEPDNLLDEKDISSLLQQVERAANDPAISGILLTGTGNRFVTGINLQQAKKKPIGTDNIFAHFEILLYNLFTFPKPVVAAVNGHSIGGGLLLQCCADRIILADNPKIKIGLPEVNLGLTVDTFMYILLRYCAVSDKKLSTMLLTGEYLNATEALAAGFVDIVTPEQELQINARLQLENFLNKPSKAFALTKSQVRATTTVLLNEAMQNKSYRTFNSFFATNI